MIIFRFSKNGCPCHHLELRARYPCIANIFNREYLDIANKESTNRLVLSHIASTFDPQAMLIIELAAKELPFPRRKVNITGLRPRNENRENDSSCLKVSSKIPFKKLLLQKVIIKFDLISLLLIMRISQKDWIYLKGM